MAKRKATDEGRGRKRDHRAAYDAARKHIETAARGAPRRRPRPLSEEEQERRAYALATMALDGRITVTHKSVPRPPPLRAFARPVLDELAHADVSTEAGRQRLLKLTCAGSHVQLEEARRLVIFVESTIVFGGDANWWLLHQIYEALYKSGYARFAVVGILKDLAARRRGPSERDRAEEGTQLAAAALRELGAQHEAFASIHATSLLDVVKQRKLGALGMAAKLSLECGAFGDEQRNHEKAPVAYRRVKRNYEKALESVRRLARSKQAT